MQDQPHLTKLEATEAIKTVRDFMPQSQLTAIADCMRGEEKQFFFDKMVELAKIIKSMPVTYEQDGKGKQAIAYLHYFRGNADYYITEKDKGVPVLEGTASIPEDSQQLQAFGLADLGEGFPEMGYISIVELIGANVELDLYFEPKTLAEIAQENN